MPVILPFTLAPGPREVLQSRDRVPTTSVRGLEGPSTSGSGQSPSGGL